MITAKRRFAILARDDFRCTYCGATSMAGAQLEVDHIHPASQGGSDDDENLTTSCWDCNRGKRGQTIEQAAASVTAAWGSSCVTPLCIAAKADQAGLSYRKMHAYLTDAGHTLPPLRSHDRAIAVTDVQRMWLAQVMEDALA